MAIELDHLILPVNDRARSIDFYTNVIGLQRDPESGSFSVMRVTPNLQLLLAAWGTRGGQHLAFAMSKAEFDAIFERIVNSGIAFGDRFDAVGNAHGPSDEDGARGIGKALYFFDPDQHLIEIRHYNPDS
jgi:catechol 2,3-dioxygenase-like lactoylglutathione lyase family enzyme